MQLTNNNKPAKIQRVFDYMSRGKTLTPRQAKVMFKVSNVRATMHDLREAFGRLNYPMDVIREIKNGISRYRLQKVRR